VSKLSFHFWFSSALTTINDCTRCDLAAAVFVSSYSQPAGWLFTALILDVFDLYTLPACYCNWRYSRFLSNSVVLCMLAVFAVAVLA